MTKEEEIEAAYRERELQEEQRIDELYKEAERQEEVEYYQELLEEYEREKAYLDSWDERDAEIEASVDSYFDQEEESETVSQKRHSSIDYESLTMNAIMGGYGDVLGFD